MTKALALFALFGIVVLQVSCSMFGPGMIQGQSGNPQFQPNQPNQYGQPFNSAGQPIGGQGMNMYPRNQYGQPFNQGQNFQPQQGQSQQFAQPGPNQGWQQFAQPGPNQGWQQNVPGTYGNPSNPRTIQQWPQ